jgi:hypothetical protein
MMKQYKYFYAKNLNRQSDCIISNPRIFKDKAMQVLFFLRKKNLNRQSDCIVSNPRIFKDEAIHVPLLKKFESTERSLQNTESFSDEVIQLLLLLLPGRMRRFTDLILR